MKQLAMVSISIFKNTPFLKNAPEKKQLFFVHKWQTTENPPKRYDNISTIDEEMLDRK